jgi:hypothetical protein
MKTNQPPTTVNIITTVVCQVTYKTRTTLDGAAIGWTSTRLLAVMVNVKVVVGEASLLRTRALLLGRKLPL